MEYTFTVAQNSEVTVSVPAGTKFHVRVDTTFEPQDSSELRLDVDGKSRVVAMHDTINGLRMVSEAI